MKLIARCQACGKKKLFVRRRDFKHHFMGAIRSQSELCGTCYGNIKRMIKEEKSG